MNHIEITVPMEHTDQTVVTLMDDTIAIGYKRFIKIGQVSYEWTHDYLTKEDAQALINSLRLAITLMDEPV